MQLCEKGFTFTSLFRACIGGSVMAFLYSVAYKRRVRTHLVVIIVMIMCVTGMVPVMIVAVIMMVPVIMVSVVVVPVVRSPRTPVGRIVTPVPAGMPDGIAGKVNEPYQRPCGNFIWCGPYHRYTGNVP
jgi:hypothetical protein